MQLLSLEGFSGLIITRDKSCENSETKASSPMQRDGLSVPVSGAGGEICRCCIWDVQHGSHQAPFPPFKQVKTSLQHFCASPELLRMPVLKGCKGLWNGLSPLCTKRRPGFLHIIFSCCDRTTSTFLCELGRRRGDTKWWFGGQGSVHCLPWPDGEVAAHFLSSSA